MRNALVPALLLVLGSSVEAAPRTPGVIWGGVKPARAQAFTSVSHVLYLNDCLPNGCAVRPGSDDARTDTSSIAAEPTTLGAWQLGPAAWSELVDCVKETYAPFNIEIVTEDPGTAPHFEVMIGGHATQLNPELDGAGGVAPYLSCGAQENNGLSFVFAADIPNLTFLCHAVAQESAHVWGLDHQLDPKDPMTYLEPGTLKRFQDHDAECGEFEARECYCGGTTQNSYQYLMDVFGPRELTPPSMVIASPANEAWVKPGFHVRAQPMTQVSVTEASLLINGTSMQTMESGPYVFTAPTSLAGGKHVVTVKATDSAGRTFDGSISVNVTPACGGDGACPDGLHCLGGLCLPGAAITGGLGAACSANEECITGMCAQGGGDRLCTGSCDAGGGCPDGFTCAGTNGAGGVCWPSVEDDGGCTTSSGSPGWLVLALGIGLVARRRKR